MVRLLSFRKEILVSGRGQNVISITAVRDWEPPLLVAGRAYKIRENSRRRFMMRVQSWMLKCVVVLGMGAAVAGEAQTVAATPPMGWNSWNFFAGKVTDKDIRDTADLLVSTGMRDAVYVYVNIDDTWEA